MSAFRTAMDYLGLGRDDAYGDSSATPPPRWQRAFGALGGFAMVATLMLTRSWVIEFFVVLAFMAILLGPSIIKERRTRAQPSEPGASDDPR
jgi:hypothetical protein